MKEKRWLWVVFASVLLKCFQEVNNDREKKMMMMMLKMKKKYKKMKVKKKKTRGLFLLIFD